MSEITDAIQIIRISFEGVELAMRLTGMSFHGLKILTAAIKQTLRLEKQIGKVNMRRLLREGNELQVFQFPTQELKKVEKLAKKYGILYSMLPDINEKDGMSEFVFSVDALPRVNAMIEKLRDSKVMDMDGYLNNADPEETQRLIEEETAFVESEEKEEVKKETDPEPPSREERKGINRPAAYSMQPADSIPHGFSNFIRMEDIARMPMAERIKVMNYFHDPAYLPITITKKLVVDEDSRIITARLPKQKDCYIQIPKEELWQPSGGKTLLAFLGSSRPYTILDRNMASQEKELGQNIYQRNFDPVNLKVKEAVETLNKEKYWNAAKEKRKSYPPKGR